MHSRHPVQSSSFTYRGRCRTLTVKSPVKPSTLTTSAYVHSVMFGCERTWDIFGVRMQAEQSSVGNVLSNLAMWPPIVLSRSTRYTCFPASAIVRAAVDPGDAAADDQTSGLTSALRGSRYSCRATRRTAPATSAFAFCGRVLAVGGHPRNVLADAGHLEVERALAALGRRPAERRLVHQGEHEATTTRLMTPSRRSFSISSWPGSEHMNL